MVVLASSHCRHGQWSSGRCRACPVGQVWRTGTGCVVATDPRLPLTFGTRCVPANCTHGYTPAGTCRACPSGQTQLAAFGTACVPAECTYGYTSTGACEAASPTHRYTALKCTTYSADASAQEYLDIYGDKKLDQATCPPQGLFLASPGVADWPKWGFQKSVADDYGKIVVEELGECSGPSDSANIDYPDTGTVHDFQVPCKAHDYCFDLRRAGFTETVTDERLRQFVQRFNES